MRIVCPSCRAAYDVPEAVVAARRTLRCSQCSIDFPAGAQGQAFQPAEAPVRPAAPAEAPRVEDAGRFTIPLVPGPPRPHAALVPAAWLLSLLLLGAGFWAAMAWRVSVMHAWPASTRLYAALGYLH